ncbi:MAG: nucleoside recognition domain-containing protein [Bacteroides sp.]
MKDFPARFFKCVKTALPKAGKTSLWLLKIILPVSLFVRLLQYYGVIAFLAEYLNPVFSIIGLPGETAIIFITSIFLPLYATIAVMTSLAITLREATILTLMCLVAHNLLVECAVTKKTGSSFAGMFTLRIGMAFVIAFFLNTVMPQSDEMFGVISQPETYSGLAQLFTSWISTSTVLIVTIVSIVTALMIIQRLLDEYKLIGVLSRPLAPLMKFFGLPKDSPFLWIVGNVVGLAYGGAVMIDMVEEGKLSLADSNVVNYHLAISHSLLEDTILFAALGINLWWIMGTRLLFAFIVVWSYRLIHHFNKRKQITITV